MRKQKPAAWTFFAITLALLGAGVWYGSPFAEMAAAYKAKTLCSAAFVSGREVDSGNLEDVSIGDLSFLRFFQTKIDHEQQTVAVSLLGLKTATAVYRKGIGATLAIGKSPAELKSESLPGSEPSSDVSAKPWPEGDQVDLIASPKLNQLMESAFTDPDNSQKTRAIVIVHDGRIIAEKYAPGFSADMPLRGWSMAKSVTGALIGILVKEGKLSLTDDGLFKEWQSQDDPRRAITLDNMLRMSSGLDFNENYSVDPRGDIAMMLYRSGDASGFALKKPLLRPPGTHFQYASATSNLLSRVIRETISSDEVYHAFPKRALFDRIGARSALLERDATGTFVGSSFMYATARDWARLGLFFANDGVWNGERILPEGWVDYCRTSAPADPAGKYGAHFWVKIQNSDNTTPLPKGIFHMTGHEGQYVSILPEEKLVVVRLGFTLDSRAWDQEKFVAGILESMVTAIKKSSSP